MILWPLMKSHPHALYLPERHDWVDVAHEARRWELDEERVTQMVEQVEEEKELELTLKLKRREQELLEYLRRAHDKEAENATCKWDGCTAGNWDTWGDLAAHIRTHLILEGDEKVARAALADAEKLIHPVDHLELKVKTVVADRALLLKKVSRGLERQLSSPPKVLPDTSDTDESEAQ